MASTLYDLHTRWDLPASADRVWAVIADRRMSWPDWWPGCTADGPPTATPSPEGTAGAPGGHAPRPGSLAGRSAGLAFHAGPGYVLHLTIRPTSEQPGRFIEFDAEGDLCGHGRVALVPVAADRTRVHIQCTVAPTPRWMVLLSPVAAPLFAGLHGRMMRRGEQGLRRILAAREAEDTPPPGRGRRDVSDPAASMLP